MTLIIRDENEKSYLHILKYLFEQGDEDEIKNRKARQHGDIYHLILSNIGNMHGQDSEKILMFALKRASEKYPYADINKFGSTVRDLVNSPKLQKIFFQKDMLVNTEIDVVDSFGYSKRIDRLIVFGDKAVIIDFKSKHEKTSTNKEQVKEYIRLIQNIMPGMSVSGALVYIEDKEMELIDE